MFLDRRKKLLAAAMLVASCGLAEVVVNEVCYKNDRADDGSGSVASDWIELYNNGNESVDVGGYALGKKKDYASCGSQLCVLPSYVMDPGEFLVVFFDKDLPASTNWVEMVVKGKTKLVPWVRCNAFNLGSTEYGSYLVQDDVRLFDGTKNHVRISNFKGEVVAALVPEKGADRTLDKNTSCGFLWDGAVPQAGYAGDSDTLYLFARPTPWAANASGLALAAPTLSLPPGVYASDPTIVVNNVDDRTEQLFYTLDGSDPRTSPTRMEVKDGGTVTVVARPDATAASGAGQTNAWIRTSPVELGSLVPGADWLPPIGGVDRLSTLRVVAKYGPAYSVEAGGDYCIGSVFAQRRLPIVSLRAEPDDLFSDARGIYVPGDLYLANGFGDGKWGKPNANYFAKNTEVRAAFSLLEPDASRPEMALELGISPDGGGVCALPQKTLKCALRGTEYGARDLDYALIPALGEQTYRRFLLASGGKDWNGPQADGVSTLIKDAALQRIASGLNVDNVESRPALVYLNGDYWGIHYLRESEDKHDLAMRHGLNVDNLDILQHQEDASGSDVVVESVDGEASSVDDYQDFLKRLDRADLSTSTGLSLAEAEMDLDSYMDYIIAGTFFANADWPVENCTFWRTHTNETASASGDCRWRWRLTGLDLAGVEVDGVKGEDRDMLEFLSSNPQKDIDESGFLVNRLWKNPDFAARFVSRYVELLNTTFHPDRTAAAIRGSADEIADEVERHYRRWGRDFTRSQWSAAVESTLVDFLAQRWRKSFDHLDKKFNLGGVGDVEVFGAVGGTVTVDGVTVTEDGYRGRAFAGQTVTLVAKALAGYDFAGWSDGVQTATRTLTIAKDGQISVRPQFSASSTPCRILFDANGGAGTMTELHFVGPESRNLPANAFSRSGFLFVGWALTPDGTVAFNDGARVCALTIAGGQDVTLHAVWQMGRLFPASDSSGIAAGETAPWELAAVVYDGYVYDAQEQVHGTLQVKVGKMNRRSQFAKVTAVFVPADGSRKCTFRNGLVGLGGIVGDMAAEGRSLRLVLGRLGLSGTLGTWKIDGARNRFASKDKAEKAAVAAMLPRFQPGCAVVWRERVAGTAPGTGWSGLSAVVGTKGKVKVSGMLASGVKVSATGQLLLGAEHSCVPVVVVKKAQIAFNAWAGNRGWTAAVDVLGFDREVVAGTTGGTFAGTFTECAIPAPFALGTKGYEGWRPRVAAKTGALKGTFKVYAPVKGKPKKFSAAVNGVVVDGVGYGTAVVKKNASWAVKLR